MLRRSLLTSGEYNFLLSKKFPVNVQPVGSISQTSETNQIAFAVVVLAFFAGFITFAIVKYFKK